MFIKITLFLILLTRTVSKIIPVENANNSYACINKIYNTHYELNTLLYVYNETSSKSLHFINSTVITTEVYNKRLINKLWTFNMHIIIIDNLKKMNDYLNELFKSTIWNNNAKFVIMYFGNETPLEIFKITWKYYIVNIVLIIDGKIFTHYPFKNGGCGQFIIPEIVNKCSENFTSLYEEKIPSTLNGCELRLMGLNLKPYVIDVDGDKDDPSQAGIEVTVLHTIIKKMNFTEKYIYNPYTHWGYYFPNKSFTFMLKDLYEGKADVIFGMMIGNNSIGSFFDNTVSHIDTTAVWFVPTALPIAHWKNLTVIFESNVWLAIFLMFIINGCMWWLTGRNKERINEYKDLILSVMSSFHVLLQGSVKHPKSGLLRMLLMTWTFSCLLLFTAHQCQLTGILTSPLYEHQISNLKELVTSNLQYGFYPVLLDLYSDKNNWVHRKVLENYVACSLDRTCINRTAYQRDFAVVKNKREGNYLIPRYYSYPNGKSMLYTFNEVEFVVWVKYFTYKGFPFLERINRLIFLLQSSGFIAKWEDDIVFIRKKGVEISNHQKLSLSHLEGAFYILIIGLMSSIVVFILELIKYKLKKRLNKKVKTENDNSE